MNMPVKIKVYPNKLDENLFEACTTYQGVTLHEWLTKEVPDYALMVGNPAKNIGWMSEFGERLIFNENGIAICDSTESRYQLNNNLVNKIDE